MAKVTLQSIADQVGVSRMTVSNAFSRPDQLSVDLRDRILAAASELGYVGPDPAARALAKGRTGSIGLLLNGPLTDVFSDEIAAGFVAAISDGLAAGGQALTVLTPPVADGFVPARDVAVDGCIVYTCEPTFAGVEWLKRRGIPMVAVDQDLGGEVPRVTIEDRAGAYAAARHLLDLGHTRIGLLTISGIETPDRISVSHTARERMAGWRRALDEAAVEPTTAFAPYQSPDQPLQAALDLLRDHDLTAVLCFSDVLAYAVVRAAEQLGRRVPEELSIVGFDDNPLAAAIRPALTTVRQDVGAKGRAAVTTLLEVMAGGHPGSVTQPTSLVVRDSTAAPR